MHAVQRQQNFVVDSLVEGLEQQAEGPPAGHPETMPMAAVNASEPTHKEAADLYWAAMNAGTVERVDLIHQALLSAYRRGENAERINGEQLAAQAAARFAADAERLAREHARDFADEHARRAKACAERDARPWWSRGRHSA